MSLHPITLASLALVLSFASVSSSRVAGQQAPGIEPATQAQAAEPAATTALPLPPDYVIGADDVLTVVFWREKDMSGDVTVRPDGKISLPLLNEVQAAGQTPEQLRTVLIGAASKYVEEPTATVVVKEIRSRNVFITGNVVKPGTFVLMREMNVLQLIAVAGGLQEYADSKGIRIIRTENGRQQYFKFNYNDIIKQKNVEQNITLKPGDTVVVP